jgi:hypothetical protein
LFFKMNSPVINNQSQKQPADKNSTAEDRALERIYQLSMEDSDVQTWKYLLLANPEPSNGKDEEKAGRPQPIDFITEQTPDYMQTARSLRKIPLRKRFSFATENLLTLLSITYEMERRLCIGEDDSKAWYFHNGSLVDAVTKKSKDDRFANDMKRFNDSRAAGHINMDARPPVKEVFHLLGAQEIAKMRKLITDELINTIPAASEELWTLLKGPKTSYVYNVSEIKVLQFDQIFVRTCCEYIYTKFKPVAAHFDAVYADYIAQNVFLYVPASGRKGEQIATLANKMMDPIIALLYRFDDSKILSANKEIGQEVYHKLAELGYNEPFLKFADIKIENLRSVMVESFKGDSRNFYRIMLKLAELVQCDKALIRWDLINAAINGRPLVTKDQIKGALIKLSEQSFASSRMINAFFSAVNVENLSERPSSRKLLPVFRPLDMRNDKIDGSDVYAMDQGREVKLSFERLFMENFQSKMLTVNADEKDPKKLAYVVSSELFDNWVEESSHGNTSFDRLIDVYLGGQDGRGFVAPNGAVYYRAISPDQHGYEQKFTMSLISAAKVLDGKKPIEVAKEQRGEFLANIECAIIAVALYKQFKRNDIISVETKFQSDKKLAAQSHPFIPQQNYGAIQQNYAPAHSGFTQAQPLSPAMAVSSPLPAAAYGAPPTQPSYGAPPAVIQQQPAQKATRAQRKPTVAPVATTSYAAPAADAAVTNAINSVAGPTTGSASPPRGSGGYGGSASPPRGSTGSGGYGGSASPPRGSTGSGGYGATAGGSRNTSPYRAAPGSGSAQRAPSPSTNPYASSGSRI